MEFSRISILALGWHLIYNVWQIWYCDGIGYSIPFSDAFLCPMKHYCILEIFWSPAVNCEINFKLAHRAPRTWIETVPYHVQYHVNGDYKCGGALISTIHVLTAAHCIYQFISEPQRLITEEIVVLVGSNIIGAGQAFRVQRISAHYAYNTTINLINDIAVVTLRNPVIESSKVKIVALPSPNLNLRPGSLVTVSGFGSEIWYGPMSGVLKKAMIKIVSDEQCFPHYHQLDMNAMICAAYGPGFNTCGGDSGGPLVYNNQIVGIVSFGTTKCDKGYPDVYTRVSNFPHYVQYEMGALGSEYSYISNAVDVDQIRSFYG